MSGKSDRIAVFRSPFAGIFKPFGINKRAIRGLAQVSAYSLYLMKTSVYRYERGKIELFHDLLEAQQEAPPIFHTWTWCVKYVYAALNSSF